MATLWFETDARTEKMLQKFAETLLEEGRPKFAAIEATQRGYGGINCVAELLGCSTKAIEFGFSVADAAGHD